jgi:hypothetical protein
MSASTFLTPEDRETMFLVVASHLLAQNKRSFLFDEELKEDVCQYKGARHLRCAVGCLIPPENYSKAIEGEKVANLSVLMAVGVAPDDERAIGLLEDLQMLHDSFEPHEWPDRLALLADERGFTSFTEV